MGGEEAAVAGRDQAEQREGAGDQIAAITWFWDTSIFPYFGLPRRLPA